MPIIWIVLSLILLFISAIPAFSQNGSNNLQVQRAVMQQQAMQMKKQQEIAIFKKQRDELLIAYKTLLKNKNAVERQMKIAEHDYKTASAKFNEAQGQEKHIEAQISELRNDRDQNNNQKIKKLQELQSKLVISLKQYSAIQQQSYENMLNNDAQFRNFLAKEQILRQQIETTERQLQFVISQP